MVCDVSYMFVTGPDVVKAVTGESVSQAGLGGAEVHASKSGVIHNVYENEIEAFRALRKLYSFLPLNNQAALQSSWIQDTPKLSDSSRASFQDLPLDPTLDSIVPWDSHKPYDMKHIIARLADDKEFFEPMPNYGTSILIGFVRFAGTSVGVVANQPLVRSGVLDIDASFKAGRFVRFCDAFGIPILTLVDVPGFLPGVQQESGGIIRHGAKLLYAFAEATVPKLTILTRKAYGGAYDV